MRGTGGHRSSAVAQALAIQLPVGTRRIDNGTSNRGCAWELDGGIGNVGREIRGTRGGGLGAW